MSDDLLVADIQDARQKARTAARDIMSIGYDQNDLYIMSCARQMGELISQFEDLAVLYGYHPEGGS